MRILITGGAGFIGSHLAEALLDGGHTGLCARRPVDRLHRQHHAPQGQPEFPLHHRHRLQRPAGRGDGRSRRRDLPPGRRGRREADRRTAGAHHRDQRARHRSDPPPRREEEEAGVHRLDLGGLRQERQGAVQRGDRPGDGRDDAAPLGVCVQQGARRVPGAGVLEGNQAAGDRDAVLQHRRAAADRAVRHGGADLRAPGAQQRADHGVRRRHAAAQLHLRRRRGRRAAEADGRRRRRLARSSTSATPKK